MILFEPEADERMTGSETRNCNNTRTNEGVSDNIRPQKYIKLEERVQGRGSEHADGLVRQTGEVGGQLHSSSSSLQ